MATKNVKKRNWAFIVYPSKSFLDGMMLSDYDGSQGYGSAPDDWMDILAATGLQCAISPLHDKDFNPDGVRKKPHFHVIACYSGPTSFNVVKALTDSLNCPIPQPLEQVRGYYRYLTHKDNPEKAQYLDSDISTVNGFCILDFVELSKSEVLAIKRDLQSLIRKCDILEYSDLMDLLQDSDMTSEYDVASSNTYFFEKYISSRRNKRFPRQKDEK